MADVDQYEPFWTIISHHQQLSIIIVRYVLVSLTFIHGGLHLRWSWAILNQPIIPTMILIIDHYPNHDLTIPNEPLSLTILITYPEPLLIIHHDESPLLILTYP